MARVYFNPHKITEALQNPQIVRKINMKTRHGTEGVNVHLYSIQTQNPLINPLHPLIHTPTGDLKS